MLTFNSHGWDYSINRSPSKVDTIFFQYFFFLIFILFLIHAKQFREFRKFWWIKFITEYAKGRYFYSLFYHKICSKISHRFKLLFSWLYSSNESLQCIISENLRYFLPSRFFRNEDISTFQWKLTIFVHREVGMSWVSNKAKHMIYMYKIER